MAGAVAKTYGVQVWGKAAPTIYTVGIMPCTAKKYEASRPEFGSAYEFNRRNGEKAVPYPDIDTVLTTRDLARLFKKMKIDLAAEKEAEGDSLLTEYTGAGTIFGNTGGVMEAALRTAHAVLTGQEPKPIEFQKVRGLKGVKSAAVVLYDGKYKKDVPVRVAVVHGLKENITPIVDEVFAGRSPYHFIEVMNCPGGCINGGGQPIQGGGSSWLEASIPWLAWK